MNSSTAVHHAPVFQPPAETFRSTGPVVSVYLNTNGAVPGAAEQIALRWRNLRRRLRDSDRAPEGALDAIEPLTARAHTHGPTLVAVADEDGPLYTAHLPDARDDDLAVVAPLPHLVPLLAVTQRLLPYIAVLTDRVGADLIVVKPEAADVRHEVRGEEEHVTKVAAGGWSQRRYQQRAENRWEANAREVADELTRLVDRHAPRLVALTGDVRAVPLLREQVPARVAELLAEIPGEYRDTDEVLRHAQRAVAERVEADTSELLAAYEEELGQADRATSGPAATLEVLPRGQVDTLLLDPSRLTGQTAWFGPEPAQVAATPEVLRAGGVRDPRQAPLADVAVRAALGTAAAVRVLPPDAGPLADGIGALLRYR